MNPLQMERKEHSPQDEEELNLLNVQFTLNEIENRRAWANYNKTHHHNDRILSSSTIISSPSSDTSENTHSTNHQIELIWRSGTSKVHQFTTYLRERAPSTINEVQNLLQRHRMIGLLLFLFLLPIYCIAQLFLSFRDQILIILWRSIVIDNSSLRIKLDYRQEMIMKSKGFGFYREKDLQYILYRISRRYYILFFNCFTLFLELFSSGTYYIKLDQVVEGISTSIVVILQVIIYLFIAYINLLSKRKTRGDVYDYLSKFHPLQYVNIIDSDHTEFKSLHEIKEDILTYGYVFLTTANQGYFILSVRDLPDLDIHDLISEKLLRNDQEILFIKIKNPYNMIVIEKLRMRITVYKEKWSFQNILRREINADILIMDMKIYNLISLLFLMIYYLTSINLPGKNFYLLFVGLIILFGCIFIFRIRRYTNIQFRIDKVINEGSGSSNFVGLYYLERKGKQKALNPWWKMSQKKFYQIFNGTILEGRVGDVLLRCTQDLSYCCWERGLIFDDFMKYIDHLSNINAIGIKMITKEYLLYNNIEKENLSKVIVYENGEIRLEDVRESGMMIDFKSLTLVTKEQLESLKLQRIH